MGTCRHSLGRDVSPIRGTMCMGHTVHSMAEERPLTQKQMPGHTMLPRACYILITNHYKKLVAAKDNSCGGSEGRGQRQQAWENSLVGKS